MKKNIIILLISIIGVPTQLFSNSIITLGYNSDLVPSFYWKDTKNNQEGIDAEIISNLFKRCNYLVDISFYPWKRLMVTLASGEIHMGGPGFKTHARENFAIYLDKPLNYATFSIFVRKGESFPYHNLSDLHGKLVGINRGYSISPEIDTSAHKGKIEIMPANTAEINLNKLIFRRIDIYVGNHDAVLFKAMQMKILDKIEFLPTPISEPRPVYLMISKKAHFARKAEIINNLNKHLTMMWNDNTIDRIIDKYRTKSSIKGK
jgi:polar amino acid transport system substrate-binding protein